MEDDKFDGHKIFDLIIYLAVLIYFQELFGDELLGDSARLHPAVSHNGGLLVLYYYALMHGAMILC